MNTRKQVMENSQQLMMQILYWALHIILFIVLFAYPNSLHDYWTNYNFLIVLWSLLHLCAFFLHYFVRSDPGYIPINTDLVLLLISLV